MTEKKSFRASCKEQRHEEELCGARSITEQSWGDVTLEMIHTSLNHCKYTYRSHMTFTCEWSPLTCERFIHRALLLFLRDFSSSFSCRMFSIFIWFTHLIVLFTSNVYKFQRTTCWTPPPSHTWLHLLTNMGDLWSRVKWLWFVCECCGVWGDIGAWCGFLLLLLSGTEKRTSSDSQNTWCEPQSVRLEVYQFSITNGKENVSMSLEDL